MFLQLRVLAAVALIFGSASTVLAASKSRRGAHRHQGVERSAPPISREQEIEDHLRRFPDDLGFRPRVDPPKSGGA
jgi:hypothetical protein